jgi:hypothetical protein
MKINITKTQRARLVKDWLNDMFSGAEIKDTYYGVGPEGEKLFSNKFGGSYYVKNGKRLAFQDKTNKEVRFDYDEIWSFLESMFSLEGEELRAITEDWLKETLNLKGSTTLNQTFD